MPLKVAIIGGGVNGVCCGVKILEYYKSLVEVTIFSEVFTPNTTGDGSAGLWGPYLLGQTKKENIGKWSKSMHDFLEKLWISESAGVAGVCLIPVINVTTSSDNEYLWKNIVYGARDLSQDELQQLSLQCGKEYKKGVHFNTYTSEPKKLLPYLMELFRKNCGTFVQKKIENLDDFIKTSDYDAVIVCTGMGAKELCDKSVYPIRGQVIRVKANWQHSVFMDDENYIIPNCNSVVLGGTHQENDYNINSNTSDKNFIMSGCYKIVPGLKNTDFIADWVGLRPGRHEICIRKIVHPTGKIIIHNYGHGGAGVTLCWGCAEEVLTLLKNSSKL